jgi:UMF1 family MFS transporter
MKLSKEILGWVSYDFANSSFTTVIVTVAYSVYFKTVVVGQEGLGDYLWGLAMSISMLIVALSSPILGAIADASHSKKKFLLAYCYTSVIFTAILFFIGKNAILPGMLFFIIANIGFEGGNVFYNAFLPEIASQQDIGKVSGLGWGIGYLGGLIALVIALPFIETATTLVFPLTALFFGVFAIPVFIWVKERRTRAPQIFAQNGKTNYIKAGYRQLAHTFKHIRNFKELAKFLLAFFLYNDGIKTVIAFAAIFGAQEFGMTGTQLIVYFIIANVSSFFGAIVFGYVTDKLGPKRTISITLLLWIGVIIWAFLCPTVNQFYGVGFLAGLAIGSSQATSRTMMAILSPRDKYAEFFGFYAVSGKAAAIIGPFLYGLIVLWVGSQRLAILSILAFFVAGFILLQTVNERQGIKAAQAYDKAMAVDSYAE